MARKKKIEIEQIEEDIITTDYCDEMSASFIDYAVPLYCSEGKSQLVIAVGCTGGKHRSVVFAELVEKHLKEQNYNTSVIHRDITK